MPGFTPKSSIEGTSEGERAAGAARLFCRRRWARSPLPSPRRRARRAPRQSPPCSRASSRRHRRAPGWSAAGRSAAPGRISIATPRLAPPWLVKGISITNACSVASAQGLERWSPLASASDGGPWTRSDGAWTIARGGAVTLAPAVPAPPCRGARGHLASPAAPSSPRPRTKGSPSVRPQPRAHRRGARQARPTSRLRARGA